ncbi:MAG TPA: AAA family ATPase, partial [Longimicrobiales bacterium]|nr:AAA family ATPase [Longimicrobiales bacterium]
MTVSDLSERLVVQLFGTPRVEGPSGTLALSPQQLTLTVLVYGHADPGLTRARAAELLWGGEPDPAARQRLRQLLSDLNRRAGQRLVATSGDRLLPAPGVGFDLSVFHRALEHAAPQEAAELVARGFARLPFDRLPDQLYDWRESTEARLERQVRVAASSMWASATAAGDRARAWSAAEALYLLDPDDPAAVERVIEARAHVGRVEEAEAAYATFVEVSDHRRVPDEIDTAIERARRLGRIATAEADGPDEVPLVGRAEALASARSIFDQLEAGEFGFVLISGESGIGKTRLLKEVRREAVMRDIRCLDAQAVELESKVPLTPLVDALRSVDLEPHLEALGRPWSAVIAAVLPAKAGCDPLADLPPIQDSALSRRLLDALYLLFERLAREQPTILFLDDLQWADATTVAALQFVQRRWT